jgi:hypothetical protein
VAAAKSSTSGLSYSFLLLQKGKVTRSWGGLQSDSKRLQEDLKEISQLSASIDTGQSTSVQGGISSLAITPTIQQKYDCPRDGYFELFTTDGNTWCFAYAGTLNLNIYNVKEIVTGDNEGNFVFIYNNLRVYVPGDGNQICKYDNVFPFNVDGSQTFNPVVTISITNPNDPCEYW